MAGTKAAGAAGGEQYCANPARRAGDRPRFRPFGFGQKAAVTHGGDRLGCNGQAGREAFQHQIEAVALGALGATWQADHRAASQRAQHQQIAGIDRHAQPFHRAACRNNGLWDHVTAIDRGRCAGDQKKIGTASGQLRGQRGHIVRAGRQHFHPAAQGPDPCGRHPLQLGEGLGAGAGQGGGNQRDGQGPEGRHHQRTRGGDGGA